MRSEWDPTGPRRGLPNLNDRPDVLDIGVQRKRVLGAARAHQVLWRACLDLGWDQDDLSQEILLRVHARQVGGCLRYGKPCASTPYDPSRGSLANYLVRITRSLLVNLGSPGQGAGRYVGDAREELTVDGWEP